MNQRGGFGSTPLHLATYRESPGEVRALLESNADPNAAGEYGERPLQVAINCFHPEIIERLLRAGADPLLTDDQGADAWKIAGILGLTNQLQEIVTRAASTL